jgi:hypothetical protein
MKINYKKSLKLIALLISSLLIATVSATAYVTLTWTNTATVVANPKVCFFWWSNDTKVNTFNYPVNIFPSIKTIDQNITHGVWNWDSQAHVTSMRWVSLTNSGNIAKLNVTVYNSTTTIYTQYWTSVPPSPFPTGWVQFSPSPMANGKYTIWMEITATSGATPGQQSVFTFEMKVENP